MTAEQLIAEQKATLSTAYGLAGKSFESVQQLVELNLATTRSTLKEGTEFAKCAFTAQDMQVLLTHQAEALQSMAGKAAAYNRQVAEIVRATAGVFAKAAASKIDDTQSKVSAAMDQLGQNAPAGFEAPVYLVKSSIAAAHKAYESLQQAIQQASDLAQTNVETMTAQAARVTKTTSSKR